MNFKCLVCGKNFEHRDKRRKFCSKKCFYCSNRGENSKNWRGGLTTDRDGYELVRNTNHPNANKAGYIRKHRLIMENTLGRYLENEEIVHHINGIKNDNRIDNLQLLNKSTHFTVGHSLSGKNNWNWKGGITFTTSKCIQCGKVFNAPTGNIKQGFGKFCSKSCKGRHYAPIANVWSKITREDMSSIAKNRSRSKDGRFI